MEKLFDEKYYQTNSRLAYLVDFETRNQADQINEIKELINKAGPNIKDDDPLIQRRAYGFRNFDNYRLRVRVL